MNQLQFINLLLISIFNFVHPCFSNAQKLPFPYKFGEILEEELTMLTYNKDTTARAIFLMNFGEMKVTSGANPKYQVKYYYRIKIVDKRAFDLADVELSFLVKRK